MLKKFRWMIHHFEEFLAASILLSMVILAFLNVLTRYFIHYSFAFTEELEVTGMVWLTMLGVSAAFKREQHLRIQYLDRYMNEKMRFIFQLFSLTISLILFSFLGYFSFFHIQELIELEITTAALEIPEWIYLLAIPLGCLLINLRILELMIYKIKMVKTNKPIGQK